MTNIEAIKAKVKRFDKLKLVSPNAYNYRRRLSIENETFEIKHSMIDDVRVLLDHVEKLEAEIEKLKETQVKLVSLVAWAANIIGWDDYDEEEQ